jgi:uncharacterized membrane protein YphA (DoxX/SURF4 family)
MGVTNSDLWSDQALACTLLRLTLGLAMFVHGANRILHGAQNFAAGMDKDFAGTILPALMVHLFGLTLPFFEAVVGAPLIIGLLTRAALLVGALLMAALGFRNDVARGVHDCRNSTDLCGSLRCVSRSCLGSQPSAMADRILTACLRAKRTDTAGYAPIVIRLGRPRMRPSQMKLLAPLWVIRKAKSVSSLSRMNVCPDFAGSAASTRRCVSFISM